MKANRVLVFGGAFNPPTLAHDAIIAACLQLPQFDAVWVMPSGDRLDKQMAASDQDRLRMLELVKSERFEDEPRLTISDFELVMPRPTQTYQTVAALAATYPNTDFWFVYGADSYASMPFWGHGSELRKILKVVLLARGTRVEPAKGDIIQLQIPEGYGATSSSAVRHLLAKGKTARGMISDAVETYITSKHLYSKR